MNKKKTKDKEIKKKETGITTEYDKTIFCWNLFIGQVRDAGYSSMQMTVKSKGLTSLKYIKLGSEEEGFKLYPHNHPL